MKFLLEISTKDANFIFNNKIFSQVDGIAMGSPVGPVFADIFVNHLEEKLMPILTSNGVLFWRRFVDDMFVILKNSVDKDKLLATLNSFDNNIVFTGEDEVDNSLPFLDINITR